MDIRIYLQLTQILDVDEVRCGIDVDEGRNLSGKVLWHLDNFDLCPTTDLKPIITASVSVLSKEKIFISLFVFISVRFCGLLHFFIKIF